MRSDRCFELVSSSIVVENAEEDIMVGKRDGVLN